MQLEGGWFRVAVEAGGAAGSLANPNGTTGARVEVQLTEPGVTSQTGYVYLFASSGSLDPRTPSASAKDRRPTST